MATTTTIQHQSAKVAVKGFEGDTVPIVINWTAGGTQVDLSTATARMQIRVEIDDATALLTLTETTGIILGGLTNNIDATLTATQTRALGAGLFHFDLEITIGSVVRTLVYGTINLALSVTRP